MALFDDTNDSRTERPTERRRRQARENGTVARSTELLTAARVLSIWIVLGWWFASFANAASSWLRATFRHTGELPQPAEMLSQLREQSGRFLATASWPLLTATAVILITHFAQIGWLWRWSNLAPQATRLSPLSGLQRLCSSATAGRALGMLLKLTLVTAVSTMIVTRYLPNTALGSITDLPGRFTGLATTALQLVSQVTFALLAFGILDYGWQRWRFEQSLRMTRQEVREELKEVEVDPRLKNQRHALAHQVPVSRSANSALETDLSR